MRYPLTAALGFLIGAAVALALVYLDPLTGRGGSPPIDGDTVYTYASPVTEGLAFTLGGASRLPRHPAGVPDLWEATIAKSALSVLVLLGTDGKPAALASRYSYPAEESDLLRRGILLKDDWLVSVPGEGSFYVTATSNFWPFLKESVLPVWYLNRPWPGPSTYSPTVGPGPGGEAIVHGATGIFAGRDGAASERYEVEAFDERVGPERLRAELHWSLTADGLDAAAD